MNIKSLVTAPSLLGLRGYGDINVIKVFLAGPIQGASDWQTSVPSKVDYDVPTTFFNPRRASVTGRLSDDDYLQQVQWETERLKISDVVLFWIPKMSETIPGRTYGQTTKIELVENLQTGKKIILGIEPGAITGERYLKLKAEKYGVTRIHETLEDCLAELGEYIKDLGRRKGDVFFTSDTHFGAQRTLELSRRPFRDVTDMDWTMIERWNNTVPPGATIWHLGDFGDPSVLKYLNGNIKLIAGNYEVTEWKETGLPLTDWIETKISQGFSSVTMSCDYCSLGDWNLVLGHEPEKVKSEVEADSEYDFGLFGHIHGRQMIKKFGLDIGQDAHNFTPVTKDDVKFFLGAIEKGYYDHEVWC